MGLELSHWRDDLTFIVKQSRTTNNPKTFSISVELGPKKWDPFLLNFHRIDNLSKVRFYLSHCSNAPKFQLTLKKTRPRSFLDYLIPPEGIIQDIESAFETVL